jgi:putrescine transport system permease protein
MSAEATAGQFAIIEQGPPMTRNWLVRNGRMIVIAVPMIWLLLFFLAPFFVVLKISFSELAIAQPPYTPLVSWQDGKLLVTLNFGNYQYLGSDWLYVRAYFSSIRIAFFATIFALLIGYPMAYAIARSTDRWRNVLLMLVMLPFWTSFLLRIYAWIGFLKGNGVINNVLMGLGLISEPIVFLQTDFAVYLGIVYTYLPFMILPLYANLAKLDTTLLEAAADLGARPVTSFFNVTLPLSLPGIVAGSLLVFIPAIGEVVIPSLLGGPDTLMIGQVLWNEFFMNRDWPTASAVAIIMLIVVVLPVMWLRQVQDTQEAK